MLHTGFGKNPGLFQKAAHQVDTFAVLFLDGYILGLPVIGIGAEQDAVLILNEEISRLFPAFCECDKHFAAEDEIGGVDRHLHFDVYMGIADGFGGISMQNVVLRSIISHLFITF